MNFKIPLFLVGIVFLSISCNRTQQQAAQSGNGVSTKEAIVYAKGFSIERFSNYTRVVVRNPWDTTQTMETYLLVDRNKPIPGELPEGTVVKIPVQRVATCSSIFAGEYQQLNTLHKIVAVSEPEYYDIPAIQDGLKQGKIANLGMTVTLDAEKLIASKVDILIVSPFEVSMHDKFKKMGIPVVKDASYMEESPLGRTEWIKFEAAFLGKDSLANVIFSNIEKRYKDLCAKVNTTKNRPTVFSEKKYGDLWYVAGGNSYMGNFMKDAGANYLWNHLQMSGSKPFTFEAVYAKAIHADYWLIKYNNTAADMTFDELGNEYELYKNFKAFKTRNVFAVNSGNTPYYEEGPLEPDVVLADMVSVFHPELLPNHAAKYYKRLK